MSERHYQPPQPRYGPTKVHTKTSILAATCCHEYNIFWETGGERDNVPASTPCFDRIEIISSSHTKSICSAACVIPHGVHASDAAPYQRGSRLAGKGLDRSATVLLSQKAAKPAPQLVY